MSIDAMKAAIEWIEAQPEPRMIGALKTITALRDAIEAAERQEPVAIYEFDTDQKQFLSDYEMARGWRWRRKDFKKGDALYATPQPAPVWQPIETAPKDKSVMLYCVNNLPIYCGRKRYGNLGEPSQDTFAWRCDSSGRFANPTHWMPLPAAPKLENLK